MQLGSTTFLNTANCKAQCLSNPACGAIYSDSNGTTVAVCQLYPKSACIAPAGRNANYPTGRIFLAAGELIEGIGSHLAPPDH